MELLIEGCRLLGIPLNEDQIDRFRRYADELIRWNRQVNLTSITDYEGIQRRHFLDSLTCLLAFPGPNFDSVNPTQMNSGSGSLPRRTRATEDSSRNPRNFSPGAIAASIANMKVIDVGAGAGFPGLPLKIVCPALELTMLESVAKKARFLEHVVQQLGLSGVQVVTARAEDLGHRPDHREAYDVVVSRAVAELAVLAELGLPFARCGGRLIAPKKGAIKSELQDAHRAIDRLGGTLGENVRIELDGLLDLRYLIVVDKILPTPSTYPRRPGIPAKRPL